MFKTSSLEGKCFFINKVFYSLGLFNVRKFNKTI